MQLNVLDFGVECLPSAIRLVNDTLKLKSDGLKHVLSPCGATNLTPLIV